MGNVKQVNVNSNEVKLGDVKNLLAGIDLGIDFSTLSDEEFDKLPEVIALTKQKLQPFLDAVNSIQGILAIVERRFNEENQARSTIFTVVDDANGDEYLTDTEVVTKTVVDRVELDKETGLNISVTCNNPSVYTKASVRAKKSAVLNAVEQGALSNNVVRTTTYQQGTFIKVKTGKKGGE